MEQILIVDDSWVARRGIANILEPYGYELLEATDGRQGIEMAKKHNPDCMLVDLLMPELDGFSVLEAMGEKGLNIPVIILTADIQETSREKCLQLGAIGFIHKPPKENELRDLIQKVLCAKGE